jgi:hypothetical protein
LAKVVLPEPVAPEIRTFFRLVTASSKKAVQLPASRNASSCVSSGDRSFVARATPSKSPLRAKAVRSKLASDGLRSVSDNCSAAGGRTIWQRSPRGRTVEQIGISDVTSWAVKAAAALARVESQVSVRSGAARHSQPVALSMPSSPGRLTTTSVTPGGSRQA